MTKKAWQTLGAATIAGFGISALLYHLAVMEHSYVLMYPQTIGLFVCMFLRGVHSATERDYRLIAIPVNGIIYAVVILNVFGLISRTQSHWPNTKKG